MTNVQTVTPFMTGAPYAAGSPPQVRTDAEQAFLAALAHVSQLTAPPPAPSAAGSPAEGSPKAAPDADITSAEGDEGVSQILLTGSELLLSGMMPEVTVPTETGTGPTASLLASPLALQASLSSPVTIPGAELSNILLTASPASPVSTPKTPPRQTLSSPALTPPILEAPPGPPISNSDPDPLPASAAILSNLSVPEERVTSAPVSSDSPANPVGPDTVRNRELRVGSHLPEAVHNIAFFQSVDETPQSNVSADPPAGLSPSPVPQHQMAKPVPFSAVKIPSDHPAAGIRIALRPDVLSSRAGPQTTTPAPAGPEASQEESVLRALWVGSTKDDKPAKPGQGHALVAKGAPQDGAIAVALPMSQDAASPLPSPSLSADPTLAETVLSTPQPGTESPPQADPPPVFPGSDRAYSSQPVDPASLSVSVLTERSTASSKLDAPAPPPPAPLPPQMQIVQAISTTNVQTTEILLSPEELGHVRIDMRSDGERMVMTVSAERQDTLDLLRRNADQLAAELRAAGQSGVTLSFGRWSGSGFGAAPDGQPQGTPSAPHSDPENLPPLLPAFRPAIPASGLYLRI